MYSSNGHLFVEYNHFTGKTAEPCPLKDFPTPGELQLRFERGAGFSLATTSAKPLLVPYPGGEASRRYYQDAAIRAALEKIVQGKNRILLFLATGTGKTFIAVHLLKKIGDAGQPRRALFVCDRDELRSQGLNHFQNVFGADAAEVTGANPQKNARILIATYQTLNVSAEEEDARFLTEHYPENYFSHIIIDECHRSAWGKWSTILRRNPKAIQIGLTQLHVPLRVAPKRNAARTKKLRQTIWSILVSQYMNMTWRRALRMVILLLAKSSGVR